MPEPIHSSDESQRHEAESWVARFAPLVLEEDALTVEEIRRRLDLVDELQASIPLADGGSGLSDTVQRAVSQMGGIEDELRRRLAVLAPGDPKGLADVEAINERLAERAAKQELGITDYEPGMPLKLKTSPGNMAAGGFFAVFGLGWNAFTLIHAVLMIGGMYSSFGWPALFMLLFYAIFFFAGFAMLGAAYSAASEESIELDGCDLTITRKLFGTMLAKKFVLDPDVEARLGDSTAMKEEGKPAQKVIEVTTIDGKPVQFAQGATEAVRDQLVRKVNGYLALQR